MAGFYRITRVRPNGTETVLRDVPFTDLTSEQQQRAEAFRDSRERRDTGIRVRVYSSDENGFVAPGDADLIWDSAVNV